MGISELHGKQVLITGAGSGIGRAAALAFARRGAHIIACDISLESLKSLQGEIQALGANCLIFTADVSSESAMQALADEVHAQVGALHVLINNAGIAYLGEFLKSDLAHWPGILNINLMGVVYGCRYFIPHMLEAGGPRRVLNVASAAGNFPMPSMAAYAASKYAVNGFSEVLRMELANSPIGITTVCPGVINTAITRGRGISPSISQDQLQRLQAYYDQHGCSPDVVAEDMVRAVQQGKELVLSGPGSRLPYHLKRLSQNLLRTLALRSAKVMGYLPKDSDAQPNTSSQSIQL